MPSQSDDDTLRVLFVDDEQAVLDGLERALFVAAPMSWECEFHSDGEQALAAAENEPFHVVISDMRMPKMDGEALLRRMAETCPQTLRMVLTGHTELDQALRAVQVAHQFMSKPTNADAIVATILSGLELLSAFTNPVVIQVAGSVEHLPSRPDTYSKLVAALTRESTCSDDVANIVSADPSIAAEVLRVANSAFFGGRVPTSSVAQAVTRLGFGTVRDIVLAAEGFAGFDVKPSEVERLSSHSVDVAAVARGIAEGREAKETVFAAGLLHDIGALLLAWRFPEHPFLNLDVELEFELESSPSEAAVGATHTEVGAYLLGTWGLPFEMVDMVLHHHHPEAGNGSAWPLWLAEHALAEVRSGTPPGENVRARIEAASHGGTYENALTGAAKHLDN